MKPINREWRFVRSKILDRYLIREMLTTWAAVTAVLLVIMVGNVLARSLGRVTEGAIAPDALVSLVMVKSTSLLVTLIPLGLYLGVLLAHGRFYRDNEMAVMQACGVGWKDLFRPTIFVGLIAVCLIAILTIFATPWAARHEQTLKQEIKERSGLGFLTPGRFVESTDGKNVFFTQDINASKTQFEKVFMYRKQSDGVPAVDSARIASYQIDRDTGNEYLVFTDGQTVVGVPGEAESAVTTFKRQGILRPRTDTEPPEVRSKGKSVTQLLASDNLVDKAEFQWRISIPLAALLLAMLAVPLSYTSPREGRFSKIAIAILIYIPYANLLVLARKWIAAGTIPSWVGLWPVHVVFFLVVIWFLAKRVGRDWLFRQGLRGL